MHRATPGFGERPNAAFFSDHRAAALIAGIGDLHDKLAETVEALGIKSAQ